MAPREAVEAKSGFHPSMQAVRLSRRGSLRFDTIATWAPAVGQDRGHPASRKTPAAIHRSDEFSFLSSNPCGCPERNDLLPYRVFGMRARTCQQPPARPEAAVYRVLPGLPRAKFRPDRGPRWRAEFGSEMARKFPWPSSVTPGTASLVLATGGSHAASDTAILAIPTLFNGLAHARCRSPLVRNACRGYRNRPFNPHFVQDIGVAFLVAGLALAARAWRPRYWPAAVAGAGFLAAHALLHLVMIAGGHDHHAAFDLIAVVLPSAAALYSAFPSQGENHA